MAADMQITTKELFKCVFCLRSAPGHKTRNSFTGASHTAGCSREIKGAIGISERSDRQTSFKAVEGVSRNSSFVTVQEKTLVVQEAMRESQTVIDCELS
jgi:hypothetical protein